MKTDARRERDHFKKKLFPLQMRAMKDRLSRLVPNAKSSHRVEALARGLGFGTWAAALEWSSTEDEAYIDLETARFSKYLADKGYDVPGLALESVFTLCRPTREGVIPSIDEALKTMGAETFAAMFDGMGTSVYRDYEDALNAQIGFVKSALTRKQGTSELRMPKA